MSQGLIFLFTFFSKLLQVSKFVCTFAQDNEQKDMRKSLRQRVVDMAVGETITIPVADARYSTIRFYAYEVGLSENRRYSTHLDRATKTYIITRKS